MNDEKLRLIDFLAMAQRIGVSYSWLRQEVERGRLPHIKAGKIILFNPDAVEQVLLHRAESENSSGQGTGKGLREAIA
jgi:excisionase family DNA binding protein